jgi:RNA polymerase sigma-70 factor (ECF subfamily)
MADLTEEQLLKNCLAGHQDAYRAFYQRYASRMMAVCMRYASGREEAADILQEGFIKVFQELPRFRREGSLEGWVRRIMVNTALENYRKNSKIFPLSTIDDTTPETVSSDDILSQMAAEELLQLVQELPPRYRMVFNLYAFEGLKHREIAEALGITEGTSKSNLADARNILQKKVTENMVILQKRNA